MCVLSWLAGLGAVAAAAAAVRWGLGAAGRPLLAGFLELLELLLLLLLLPLALRAALALVAPLRPAPTPRAQPLGATSWAPPKGPAGGGGSQ